MVEVASWRLFAFKSGDGHADEDVTRTVTEPMLPQTIADLRWRGYDNIYLDLAGTFDCQTVSVLPGRVHFSHGRAA